MDTNIVKGAKNVLVCNVKPDNEKSFIEQTAERYYTGKRFPSTVELDKLYYFMPYIKRKGIRDLYLIKKARIGTRKEGQPTTTQMIFDLCLINKSYCKS